MTYYDVYINFGQGDSLAELMATFAHLHIYLFLECLRVLFNGGSSSIAVVVLGHDFFLVFGWHVSLIVILIDCWLISYLFNLKTNNDKWKTLNF